MNKRKITEIVKNYITTSEKRHFISCKMAKELGLSARQIGIGFRELEKKGMVKKRAYRPSGCVVWEKDQSILK